MDLWQRAGELEEERSGGTVPLRMVILFIAVSSGTLLLATVAPSISATLAAYCPLERSPSVLAAAALLFTTALAPVLSAGSLRRAVARGESAVAHQLVSAAVLTALFGAFTVLATRAAAVPASAAAKAVLLFAITTCGALLNSAALGRWYLPAAAAALGGGPLAGFVSIELAGAESSALFSISAFTEMRALLSPGGELAGESFFGGCLILYGAILVVGLLLPKEPEY